MAGTREQAALRLIAADLDEALANIADVRKLMPPAGLSPDDTADLTEHLANAETYLADAEALIDRVAQDADDGQEN